MANNVVRKPIFDTKAEATTQFIRDTWWNNLSDTDKTIYRQEVWMRRSGQWNGGRFGIDWRPVKILGQGTFGVCGLFRYTGNRPNIPPHVVVKQSSGTHIVELEDESEFLSLLNTSNSQHIIRLYTTVLYEGGTGTNPAFDPPPDPNNPNHRTIAWRPGTDAAGNQKNIAYRAWRKTSWPLVARIYLEYCELKNLATYRYITWERHHLRPSEEAVWKLWECLAKALVVLHIGNENAFVEGWDPIIHFDIKPGNIKSVQIMIIYDTYLCLVFVSDGSNIPGHMEFDLFKVADFGAAQFRPGEENLGDAAWLVNAQRRGTPDHIAPEIERHTHPERMASVKADIYSMAVVMYDFVLNADGIVPNTIYYADCGPRRGRHIATVCGDFHGDNHGYSERFRKMLMRCLALRPTDRPTARELLREIQDVIKILDRNPEDPRITQEPGTREYRGNSFPVAPVPVGPIYNNPVAPAPLPPIDHLHLFNATGPDIRANVAGGSKAIWFPLHGDVALGESERVFNAAVARDIADAQGIAPVDHSLHRIPWLYWAFQKLFEYTPKSY